MVETAAVAMLGMSALGFVAALARPVCCNQLLGKTKPPLALAALDVLSSLPFVTAGLNASRPLLIAGDALLGNTGAFHWWSYVSPWFMSGGFSAESLPPLLMLAGFGVVADSLVGGRLSDRTTPAGHETANGPGTACAADAHRPAPLSELASQR